MWNIINSEFQKLRTHPLGAVFLITGPAFPSILAYLIIRASGEAGTSPAPTLSLALQALQFGQFSVIAIAAALGGQEYQDHQLRTTLTAVNLRWQLFISKLIVIAVTVVGQFWLSALLAVGTLALVVETAPTVTYLSDHLSLLGIAFVSWLELAWMSLGIATVFKSLVPPIAVLGSLVLGLNQLIDSLLAPAKYGPTLSTAGIFHTESDGHYLPTGQGILTQTAWMVGIIGLAVFLHLRRDVR